MKKFILAAALVACMAPAAIAQDEFAPEKGNISVEVQFNPFSNDYTTFKQSDLGLSARYFITNKDAVRLNIGFGLHKDVNNYDEEISENNFVTLHNNTRHSNFNINLGYERHLVTKGRLDLYAGAQIGVGFDSYGKTSEEYNYSEKVVEKYWNNNYQVDEDGQTVTKIGSTNLNFGIFTGVDFYVYKGLYVGAELGLNFTYKSNHRPVAKKNGEELNKDAHKQPTGKVVDFGTIVEPSLRLGWTF